VSEQPDIMKIPTTATWSDVASRILGRVDALTGSDALHLRFGIDETELTQVRVERADDGAVTMTGEAPGAMPVVLTWPGDAGVDEAGRASLIARAVVTHVESLAAFPDDDREWPMRGAARVELVTAEKRTAPQDARRHDFADHRTGAEIDAFLHYVSLIPLRRGLTDAYVEQHYPGRTWHGLVLILQAAGIFVGRGPNSPRCFPGVATVWFTDAMKWAVEWEDGWVSMSTLA